MNFSGNIAYWLGVPTAAFTTFYSYRLLFLTFLNKTNAFKLSIAHAHEPHMFMSLPLIILAFASLFIGYLTKDMIIGFGSSFWGNSIYILADNLSYLDAEFLPYHIKLIPFFFSHFGLFFAYHTSSFFSGFPQPYFQKNIYWRDKFFNSGIAFPIYTFLSRTWGFDDVYNRLLVQKFINFGYSISFRLFDLGWIAYLGPYGISKTILYFSRRFAGLSTGFIYHYAFIILAATLVLLFFLISGPLLNRGIIFIFLFTFLWAF